MPKINTGLIYTNDHENEGPQEFNARTAYLIDKYGYSIMAHYKGADSYAYTIGRAQNGRPEVFVQRFNKIFKPSINAAILGLERGRIQIDVPFECTELTLKDGKTPVRMMLRHIAMDHRLFDMLRLSVAYSSEEQMEKLGLLELVIADENNWLP